MLGRGRGTSVAPHWDTLPSSSSLLSLPATALSSGSICSWLDATLKLAVHLHTLLTSSGGVYRGVALLADRAGGDGHVAAYDAQAHGISDVG